MKLPKMPEPEQVADASRLTMVVAGIGLTGYGSWLIYHPAGYIAIGVLLFAIAIFGSLRAGR